jgi:hypothetical protein
MIYLTYILQFFLTNIFFAAVIALVLNRFNASGKHSLTELLIYSFGTAAAIVSLLLYYLFLLLPGLNPQTYFFIILILFLMLAALVRNDFALLSNVYYSLKEATKNRTAGWIAFLFASGCLLVFIGTQYVVFRRPLIEHDVLEYGAQAKIFLKERCVRYVNDRYDNESGFYFVGLHGFSFVFLSVWERVCDSVFSVEKDLFFRGITSYYTMMIVLIQFYWFSRKDLMLAFIAAILLLTSSGYIMTAMIYHLDTYRIFLLMMSLIGMLKAIEYNDKLSIFLFGAFAGLSAFTHSIGVLLSVVEAGIYFLMVKATFTHRVKATLAVLMLFMLFGGVHYLLDVVFGTGWIFKDIKFY